MLIRKAQANEAGALTALAFASKAHWGYAPDVLRGWVGVLGVTEADVAEKPVYVCALDDALAGFYALKPLREDWELDQLWVSPPFMRRGVGRALLAHALEAAFGAGARRVVVDADPNAEDFYLACGAVRYGEIPAPIPGAPRRVRPQLAFRRPASAPRG